MKPSEVFGVVVRSIGLLLVMGVLWAFYWAFLSLILGGPGNVLGILIVSIPALFVGVWFLSGPKSLISIAYQEEYEKGQK
jgi:drug/metabolite transporter (DMT)-like permease